MEIGVRIPRQPAFATTKRAAAGSDHIRGSRAPVYSYNKSAIIPALSRRPGRDGASRRDSNTSGLTRRRYLDDDRRRDSNSFG